MCVPHKCIGKTCPPIGSYKTGVDLGARFMNLFLFVKADEHTYTLVMLAIKKLCHGLSHFLRPIL